MKNLFIMVCVLMISLCFGQNKTLKVIGLWQAESAEVTSMYYDTYQFTSDSKFIFKPNEYNGLSRIINIGGKYEIIGDSIILTPHFTKELIGGYPVRSMITTLSDSWEIEGGKIKKLPCNSKNKQTASIQLCKSDDCILIDNRKYFRIKDN